MCPKARPAAAPSQPCPWPEAPGPAGQCQSSWPGFGPTSQALLPALLPPGKFQLLRIPAAPRKLWPSLGALSPTRQLPLRAGFPVRLAHAESRSELCHWLAVWPWVVTSPRCTHCPRVHTCSLCPSSLPDLQSHGEPVGRSTPMLHSAQQGPRAHAPAWDSYIPRTGCRKQRAPEAGEGSALPHSRAGSGTERTKVKEPVNNRGPGFQLQSKEPEL